MATPAILSLNADVIMDTDARVRMTGQNRMRYLNTLCSVYRTTTQAISDSTVTAIGFDAEEVDTDGMHDNATNNSRITIQLAGKYFVFGQIDYESNVGSTTDARHARIHKNGAEFLTSANDFVLNNTGLCVMQVSVLMSLAVNDYLELNAYQVSGGNLNANANIANAPTTRFAVFYVGE